MIAFVITPRILDSTAVKPPFQPTQFHVAQMFEQLQWRPARRETALVQFTFGQTFNPVYYPGAEIVKVPFKDFRPRTNGFRWTRGRLAHAVAPPRHAPTQFLTPSKLIEEFKPDRSLILLVHPRPHAAHTIRRDVNDVTRWRAVHRRKLDARSDVDLGQPLQKFWRAALD